MEFSSNGRTPSTDLDIPSRKSLFYSLQSSFAPQRGLQATKYSFSVQATMRFHYAPTLPTTFPPWSISFLWY